MLLHVPPQEGMLFFPRDSRTERTHAHSPLFRPLFFCFPLILPLSPTLSIADSVRRAVLFWFTTDVHKD